MELGTERLDWVRRVTEYRRKRPGMQGLGCVVMFFSASFVLIGVMERQEGSIAGAVVLAIGAVLVAVGARAFLTPAPWIFALNGSLMLACVVVVFVGMAYESKETGATAWIGGIVLGGALIAWGARCLRVYGRFRRDPSLIPPGEMIAYVDKLIWRVLDLKGADPAAVVEFTTAPDPSVTSLAVPISPLWRSRKVWRGLLLDDAAVFVTTKHQALAAMRDEVAVTPRGKGLLHDDVKAVLRLGQWALVGRLSPDALARLQAWQGRNAAGPIDDLEPGDETSSQSHGTVQEVDGEVE